MRKNEELTVQIGFQIPESEYARVMDLQKRKSLPSISATLRLLLRESLDARGIIERDSYNIAEGFTEHPPHYQMARKRDIAIGGEWGVKIKILVAGKKEVRTSDLVVAMGLENVGRSDQVIVSRLLKSMGFSRIQKRIGRERYWVYRRDELPEDEMATDRILTYTPPEEDFAEWTSDIGVDSMMKLKEAIRHDARKTGGGDA